MNRGALAPAVGVLVFALVVLAESVHPSRWFAAGLAGVIAAAAIAYADGRRRRASAPGEPREPTPAATRERLLRAVLESLNDPALAIGDDGACLGVNSAAERFFGALPGSLLGAPAYDLFTRGEAHAALGAALSADAPPDAPAVAARLRISARGGERTCDLTATRIDVILNESGDRPRRTRALITIRDVTELADAARIKTEFVANASHELRTPLAAIRAGLETLEGAASADAAMAARVRAMLAAHVARLEDLVRDLLDLSRVESPSLSVRVEPLRVDPLVESLRREFERAADARRLTLAFSFDPALEGAPADPSLVGLILRNLIENATKFAYEGTTVAVRAGTAPGPEGLLLRFEVEDRGVGIPLALQPRVFERFFQADAGRGWGDGAGPTGSRRGTGLGLAIARHAARAMGGRVWLHSVLREGTTVGVEIPSPPRPSGSHPPETPEQAGEVPETAEAD